MSVTALLILLPLTGTWAGPLDQPHVSDQVIIKFRPHASQADKDAVLADLSASHVKHMKRIKSDLHRIHGLSVGEAIGRYKNHPKVEYIEPNYILHAVEIPNDPRFGDLYGLHNTGRTGGTPGADISAVSAWDVFTGSSQVLIGVIDTGVDYLHPDLAANIYTNPNEIPNNGIDDDANGFVDDVRGWDFRNDDNDPMDDNGHGSHVSGTIGAVGNNGVGVVGVCWNVKIVPLKFLSSAGSGTTADAVDAVEYATSLGVHMTSNSWGGGGFSQALLDAIQDANTNGILFVAAAGNGSSNTDITPHYPSSYALPNIVSVAATDHNDQLASFSNYGVTTVDLAAPGVDILSTFPGNSYGSISGTSMATPHVAGALGLVVGRFPTIGHLDAKNLILNFADPLPNLSGVVLTGARLNAFLPIADPDSTPPAPIMDLAVTEAGSNWLVAGWSATGDDGSSGTASRYVVKYSTAPITDANFDAAMTAQNPPDPGPPGTAESMRIDGLDFDTTYYVAVKALDEFGNSSSISNVPSGTTLGIPDIAATPLSFTENLLTGASSTQSLTLSNVGFGTLDFDIPLPFLITNAAVVAEYVNYGKGGVDPRPGLLGNGGPDGFGYRWIDSDDPTGPSFSWMDISGTGTLAISSGDDVNNGPYDIGFTFPFYGVEYNSFRICSNGWLSFTSTSTAYSNQPLPNGGAPAALVAPFWDDLNLNTSGDVYYETDGSRLIVQWQNVAHYGSGGPYTFQAILHNDGTIEYQYLSIGAPDNSCTIGIQNAARSDGLQVVFNAAYVHDNLAIRIAAVPQWVTVTPNTGTIYAPNSMVLDVNFDASGLLGGTYDATIQVFSNDPDESPFDIPVQLAVTGAPDIELAPISIDFGPTFIGATPTAILQVQNPGTDVLTVSSITVDDAIFSVSPTTFTVAPRGHQDVIVTFAPIAAVGYAATLTVTSDDPDEPVVTAALAGQGLVPPDFSVSPTELSSNLFTGETETQLLTLANSGGADLDWSIGVEFVAASQLFTLTAPALPAGPDADGGVVGDPFRTTPIQAELADLTGVNIVWDRAHGQSSTSGWATIIADFTSRGATVTENTDPITPALLAGYDVVWSVDTNQSWDAAETNALVNWMAAGGGLLLEGDNASSVGVYNELLLALGAGIEFSTTSGAAGTTNNIYPHPTTENVNAVFYTANVASIPTVVAPAGVLVDDVAGVPAAAYSNVGSGHIVALSDEVFQNSRMGTDDNQLFGNQVMDWLAGTAFLSVDPTSGTVPPGGSTDVSAVFDATGLFGGLYEANVIITTNDPLAAEVTIPAALQVTGAPDLSVDPTSIDFGSVFVGFPVLRNFEIFNAGTDVLTITSIPSDAPEFSAFLGGQTFPINLAPLSTTVLQARFSPPAPGMYSGTLTIHSNDPDSPQTAVALSGDGLLPPLASVSPVTLHADLLTGETDTRQVTVSNSGASDLDWSIQLQFQAATQVSTLTAPVPPVGADDDGGVVDVPFRTTPIQVELADLTGIDIMWDRSHGQSSTSSWATIIGDLTARGATVTENTDPITPTLLLGYDILWSVDTSASWDSAEITALVNWVNGGGGLLLEGDNTASVGIYNDLLTALAAGIEYSTTDGASGTTTNIYPHATTKDVGSIYLTANVASIATVTAPAGRLVDDVDGVAATAYSQVGAGRVIAASDEVFQNSRMGTADNQLFGNQVFDWLATPVFLSVDPDSGVVSPGGSTVVDVTFDAGGLFGGDYAAIVRVLSNDPANGQLDVAATMHVTGVPRISFSSPSLDFGDVFVGYPESLVLTVTNIGTDLLSVSSITPGLPDYSTDVSSFDLAPLASQDVVVSLDPQSNTDRSSTLTFQSNDPAAPHMVSLVGFGLLPPVASVSPESLHADLLTGETDTQQFTLSNTGDSDLEWSTLLQFSAATQVATLTAPQLPVGADEDGGLVDTAGFRTTPIQAELADLTGVDIMWDRSHGQSSTSGWSTIIADLEGRGATVTENTDPITPTLLMGYEILWSIDTSSSWDPAEVAALANWMNAGGGLLLEGDNTASVGIYNDLLTALGAGIEYSTTDGADGTTSNIYPHATTQDVASIYLTANVASISTVTAPAGRLVDDVDGVAATAFSRVGAGRVIAASDEIFQNSRMGTADNQLFGNQVFDWLATPVFLSVDPASGVVPAGGNTIVDVTYDATGLFGGDYAASVRVQSNDPANPELDVAATLHVTGVPRIGFSSESLDFGDVFIGYPESLGLTVTNVGTDLLSVSAITPDLPDYSADVGSFDLVPFESRDLVVTFDPQADGDRSTLLHFASNDPDSPHAVSLAGVGVIPPVIGVSPDTLEGAAPPGGSKTKTLTVCNTGGSDLTFNVSENEHATEVPVYTELELPKGTDTPGGEAPPDPRPSILGTGGPDVFGYTWTDSDEPGGPAFDWVDISGVGSPVGFPSYIIDGNVGPVPIGFDFPFYGNTFSELYVCNNGWLSFTNSTLTAYSNQPLPNSGSGVPENMLAAWWDDMVYDESDGNEVLYYNDGSRLILQYYVRRIAQSTPPFYRFQIILYPNGNIVFQYHTLGTRVNSTTIGIQNATKDDGLTVVHNDGSYPHENLAILFSAGPDWLNVSPTSGVVPAGECVDLQVIMEALELEAGDYTGTISLTSNDPANPSVSTEVVFHVGTIDAAETALGPESLNLVSNGNWITGHIELPMGYDPADVVIETVRFMDVLPADPDHWAWDDDFNGNGVPDLMFKFDRMAAEEILPTGDSVMVWVSGEIRDTTYFVARDDVRVFRPHLTMPNGGESLLAGSSVDIVWENPENRSVDYASLYFTSDDGATWIEIATDVTGMRHTWVVPNALTQTGRIRVAVFDQRGMLGFDSSNEPFTVTDQATDADVGLPKSYALRQNVPNPFNPSTRIHFDLPNDSDVTLRIFDVRGRMVNVLVNTRLPAGWHHVDWDGLAQNGSRVASGVYFYEIKAGSFRDTKRMMVLK